MLVLAERIAGELLISFVILTLSSLIRACIVRTGEGPLYSFYRSGGNPQHSANTDHV